MFLSDGWKDYEVIDVSDGERLERFGKYILVRPDPQAIWKTEKIDGRWFKPDARYFRSNTGGGRWEFYNLPENWSIKYRDLKFNLKPMSFKHTGVFPEQAANWDFCSDTIKKSGREISVLNLFAYTGCATMACAKVGAKVCHVDAAKGMVAWAKENAASSGLAEAPVRYIVDDCKKFVEREKRRGRRYDAIIMDPPSYGRGPDGEVWKIENDLFALVESCCGLLSDDPLFFLISSYTAGLAPSVMSYMLGKTAVRQFGGSVECGELCLPVTGSEIPLPAGSATRWTK